MKKLIFCCVLTVFGSIAIAQKLDPKDINKELSLPKEYDNLKPATLGTPVDVPGFTLYENPMYKGRTGGLKKGTDGKIIPPFNLSSVSFTVAKGKIVYIKFCDTEFPYEVAYEASQGKVSLTNICGIRSDDISGFSVYFNGISTVIHNNDCKRVFGNITVKVTETSPDGTSQSNSRCTAGSFFRGTDAFTFRPFNNASASTTLPYSNHVHNASPAVPTVTTVVTGRGGVGESVGGFRVGASAIRDGRVNIIVTSNIASAHKTCDLCDDFSSNVRMESPINEIITPNRTQAGTRRVDAASPRVVLGPYNARGTRDGFAITASGGTFIDFNVHLTVTGL